MEVEGISINSGPYQDTINTYLVRPTENAGLTEEEIESAVRERFHVGDKWLENKLDLCRPNHDGSVYTVKIREPYTD
jgi:hypothetical protein